MLRRSWLSWRASGAAWTYPWRLRRLGIRRVLPRPFTLKELLAAVRDPAEASILSGTKAAIALRYALAAACVGAAVLLTESPVSRLLHPTGLFILAVLITAWFGGAGPGVFAAFLSAVSFPQLLSADYPRLGGFFDLPRFITLGLTGAALGWGAAAYRRVRGERRTAVAKRTPHLKATEERHERAIVTERERAQEALRASEERYSLAMEAAGDGHTDWNLVTDEFYVSPRLLEILGYAPDTTFADRADWVRRFPFHPDDRRRWEAAVAAHFAGRETKFTMDLRIVVNGETRWVAFTFIATRDAAGNVVR